MKHVLKNFVFCGLLLVVVSVLCTLQVIRQLAVTAANLEMGTERIWRPRFREYANMDECFSDVKNAPFDSITGNSNQMKGIWNAHLRRDFSYLNATGLEVDYIWEVGVNRGLDSFFLLRQFPKAKLFGNEALVSFMPALMSNPQFEELKERLFVFALGIGDNQSDSDGIDLTAFTLKGVGSTKSREAMDSGKANSDWELGVSTTASRMYRAIGRILPEAKRIALLHVNCEGCEFALIGDLHSHGHLSEIALIQMGTHSMAWLGSVETRVRRYCEMHFALRTTHVPLPANVPWAWERWILKQFAVHL